MPVALSSGSDRPQLAHGIGWCRSRKSLEGKLPDRFHLRELFHGLEHVVAYKDLAWLRLGTKTCSQIRHRSDRRVVEAPLEADLAKRGVALCDADAKPKIMPAIAPASGKSGHAIPHRNRHSYGARGRFGTGNWIIEQHHQTIAQKTFQRSLEPVDDRAERSVVLAQDLHHLFRCGGFRKGGKAAQVAEHDGHFAAVAFQ